MSTTKTRRAEFGNGWVKTALGKWQSLNKADFSADANPVLNIDAGVNKSKYFLATGGSTANTTAKLWETINREVGDPEPPTDLPKDK